MDIWDGEIPPLDLLEINQLYLAMLHHTFQSVSETFEQSASSQQTDR